MLAAWPSSGAAEQSGCSNWCIIWLAASAPCTLPEMGVPWPVRCSRSTHLGLHQPLQQSALAQGVLVNIHISLGRSPAPSPALAGPLWRGRAAVCRLRGSLLRPCTPEAPSDGACRQAGRAQGAMHAWSWQGRGHGPPLQPAEGRLKSTPTRGHDQL